MEKKGYREMYEHLAVLFPGKATISVKEAASVMNADVHTVYNATKRRVNPLPSVKLSKRKTLIPLTSLASWMC